MDERFNFETADAAYKAKVAALSPATRNAWAHVEANNEWFDGESEIALASLNNWLRGKTSTPVVKARKTFHARYAGRCATCPAPIRVGDLVARADNGYEHDTCGDAMADFARVPVTVDEKASGLDLSAVPAGRYAVESDTGTTAFLRIDKPTDGKWAGWTFVKRQAGPNWDRLGSARPDGTYRGEWANLLARVAENPPEAMGRYGIELGHCGACGLELTDAESRALGIGPVCRAKLGF